MPFIIGVPKEGEHSPGIPERRVALTPGGVREAAALGARVVVEKDAGAASGFSDEDYRAAGAEVVYTPEEVLGRADLTMKMSPLKLSELELVAPEKAVWGPLHLAIAREEVLRVIEEKQLDAIGYEIMEDESGSRPVLKIVSEITGKMAPQIASRLLQAPPGLGTLLGSVPGLPPADVVILGAGVLGRYAALSFFKQDALVYVLDRDREQLERIYEMSEGKIVTALATKENLEKFCAFAEVLVAAVLIPGEPTPLLVTENMLQKMRRGSVLLDFSIDQGGAIETTRRKGPQPSFYVENGLVFYSVPNVPSQVPRAASHALTSALLRYITAILQKGWPAVLSGEPVLRNGVYFHRGRCVSPHMRQRRAIHPLEVPQS